MTLCQKSYRSYFNDFRLSGFVDLSFMFIETMEDNGWRWGGAWSSADFMHFDTGKQ